MARNSVFLFIQNMTHDEYWRYYAKQNRKMEIIGVRIMSEMIRDMRESTGKEVDERGVAVALALLQFLVSEERTRQAYILLYRTIADVQIKWAHEDVEKRILRRARERTLTQPWRPAFVEDVAFGIGFENPAWLARLEAIIASTDFGARITSVTDTIRKKITQSLTESSQQYVTTSKIISKLKKDMGPGWTRARASLIARTEVTYIANLAAEQAAKELKIDLKKIWVRTLDSRTRDAHRNVIRTPIDADKKFMVGGVPMDKPGDPAGGIANTARCRCVVAYLPADDTEDFDEL